MPVSLADFAASRDQGPEGQVQMSFFDNARQSRFVKHEEKQENVSRFAGYFLDRLSVIEAPTPDQQTITLVARSAASPVARSMLGAIKECRALCVRLQVVFCQLEPAELLADWSDLTLGDSASPAMAELRWARRPGLVDAHEQMVLGLGLSWHGDSMRRDPETRDAFETFETFNTEAARRSSLAFKSIWRMSEKISAVRPVVRSASVPALPYDVLNPATPGAIAVPGSTISTRH